MPQGGRLGVSHGWERIDPTVRGGGRSPVAADAGLIDDNRGLPCAISRGVRQRTAARAGGHLGGANPVDEIQLSRSAVILS